MAFDVAGATKAYRDELEELKIENDDLAKAPGKATIKAKWTARKLKSVKFTNIFLLFLLFIFYVLKIL